MEDFFYIIVGDDYEEFAKQNHVYTVSDFYKKVTEHTDWPHQHANIIIGQGINYHNRKFIEELLVERKIEHIQSIPPIAKLSDTHKCTEENVLITAPEKLGKLSYGFNLSITDKVDRLSDHVTNQHVGAMLLMEAARQATIVVLELEYCQNASFGLILDNFVSNFNEYLFPLPTSLQTTIIEKKVSSKNITVEVRTSITQTDTHIGTISLDVTLCDSKILGKIESRKSQGAVKALSEINENILEKELEIA
ncbi:hypothetical protein HR060_00390 [Catenovulum sp. SM1970]|uniref:AfsA-related hotdog domain-containing protein n=1 Tax=Marinifaba aquimaris TaxID=2741323 RepID=UPI001574BBB2|nr:AfsA-related hotdog domain-containing protein [Marinifaba aquimaris]NTS75307.1 hypothetical protein [Marinifaba aquimaris]